MSSQPRPTLAEIRIAQDLEPCSLVIGTNVAALYHRVAFPDQEMRGMTTRAAPGSSPRLAALFLAAALSGVTTAPACTTILIGKDLTADGSILHAHNEDMGNEAVGRLWAVAPANHPEGATLRVPYVELPQAGRTLGYWASGNALGAAGLGVTGEVRSHDSVLVGMNERGVTLSCNWAWSREENREGVGLRRYALRQLLLERATSARHGVELLGAWIDAHGQADWGGLIYHLADPEEAWVVETTTSNWVARRVRDNEIRVTANRFRIGSDWDLASATLVDDALARGWLAAAGDELDFAAVYGRPGKMDQPYDTRREERVAELLAGKRGAITPEDLFPILGDRYEGTPHYTPPQQLPVWREELDRRPDLHRSIATNLAQSSFIAHLRGDLPAAVGAMAWLGLATPSWAGYVPLYAGPPGDRSARLPGEYPASVLEASAGDRSAWWLFRRLQRAGDRDYRRHYPVVDASWTARRALAIERQRRVEAQALAAIAAGRPGGANRLLAGFTFGQASDALSHVRRLLELIEPPPIEEALVGETPPASSDNAEVRGRGEGKDEWWHALPRPAWSSFPRVAQSQEWFEVHEIRPRVLAIYEPGQFEEVISYLIVGAERALLFDTGLGIGDMRRLAGELTDREVVVLNSHTHYDHVGGNHAFATVYGTGLDYTRDNAGGRPHAEVAEFVGPGWIWKETPAGFSPGEYRSRPFTVTHEVTDGDTIALGDVELEVLMTPGHAPDSLCLLDRERGLLFTGDTFYPATLYAHLPGSTFTEYQATVERLAALAGEIEIVLPAHNEPTMPPGALVELRDAFHAVQREDIPWVLTDGNREYDFGRFSLLVSDPPPWQAEP